MKDSSTTKMTDIKYTNPISVTRGDNFVVLANILMFLNDNQECKIKFPEEYGLGEYVFVFIKTEPPLTNPEISIHPTSRRTRIEFKGWNAPSAYAANDPINIGSNDTQCLNMSISTTYIGETYKADIQFYLEDRKDYIERRNG